MSPSISIKRSSQALPRPSAPDVVIVRDTKRNAYFSSALALPAMAELRLSPAIGGLAGVTAPRVLCMEEIDGRRWTYVVEAEGGSSGQRKGAAVRAITMQSLMAPVESTALIRHLLNKALDPAVVVNMTPNGLKGRTYP